MASAWTFLTIATFSTASLCRLTRRTFLHFVRLWTPLHLTPWLKPHTESASAWKNAKRALWLRPKAEVLIEHYQTTRRAFVDMAFSLHPGNIVGESAGKASNVNWAARSMATRIPESEHHYTIMDVLDADTLLAADFFLSSAVKYALAPASRRAVMMFVPPTLFDRNGAEVPVFTRAADIFWCCAGIGGIYPSSWVKIPTSAYGASLELVKYCDYWDCGPEAIGEDMHFYVKAMFETKGNVYAETIYSPASQCNVVVSAGSGPVSSYMSDMRARWSQACLLTGSFGQTVKQNSYMNLTTTEEDPDDTPLRLACGGPDRIRMTDSSDAPERPYGLGRLQLSRHSMRARKLAKVVAVGQWFLDDWVPTTLLTDILEREQEVKEAAKVKKKRKRKLEADRARKKRKVTPQEDEE
ncbi:unnamed protein product [Tilletia controversa]|nr:unnamed protein product [Tilletia controversa]